MSVSSEGPGSPIIIVYVAMTLWGMLLGVGFGWLIWG